MNEDGHLEADYEDKNGGSVELVSDEELADLLYRSPWDPPYDRDLTE